MPVVVLKEAIHSVLPCIPEAALCHAAAYPASPVLQEREALAAELAALQAQHEEHRTTSQREAKKLLNSRRAT